MRDDRLRILLVVELLSFATSLPLHQQSSEPIGHQANNRTRIVGENLHTENGDIISVRITSSVATERSRSISHAHPSVTSEREPKLLTHLTTVTEGSWTPTLGELHSISASERHSVTALPSLGGANLEYLKQLNSKKEAKSLRYDEHIHPFQEALNNNRKNTEKDSVAEESESLDRVHDGTSATEDEEQIPRGRSIPLSLYSKGYQITDDKLGTQTGHANEEKPNSAVTKVSFNIVHDTPKMYNEPHKMYSQPSKIYSEPAKVYGEPSKVYSKPEQYYSEPAKVYGEPSKVYGEPAKVYGEPSKVYSVPAKIYSVPSKFYSQPASLFLGNNHATQISPLWNTNQNTSITPQVDNTTAQVTIYEKPSSTTNTALPPSTDTESPTSLITDEEPSIDLMFNTENPLPAHASENFEDEEELSVLSQGRTHSEQKTSTEGKVGYVLEGRQYRKYRVEERTPDGFIVGEYGVVRHADGALRGVRYTAAGEASPRLIYDALMRFLQLQ